MKYKLVTASLLLALTAPAIADDDRPSTRIIEHLDQNGDGMITLDEFRGPRDGMFVHADINGDGAVTREEIKTHRDQMMAERQKQQADRSARQDTRMEEMFTSMDLNGDGAVTQDEAR
ncbi:MAG: EF-hand domain-containing protein, partial [Pseudomonadales bacterium]